MLGRIASGLRSFQLVFMTFKMRKKAFFWSLLILIICLQLSFQCHKGYLHVEPYSKSVNVGESVSFWCYGEGSHLYWFIDGINTVNMSSQEISNRGLSFSGYYNYIPPYNGDCDIQHSYLIMAGNCLNNNTEIYCVILGRYSPSDGGGNRTSSIASLVVKGDPTIVNQFTAVQASIDSLLMYWEIGSISNENYTQTITIEEDNTTVYSMELDKLDQYHLYRSEKAFDSCIQYNITFTIETINITCRDSCSITKYLTGEPLKPENVSALEHQWKKKYLIRFQFNSPMCQGSISPTIKLTLLNNNNGNLITSDVIPWDSLLTTNPPNILYQTELNVNLTDDTHYYLLITVSQSEYDETFSEPFTISTFDVINVQYSFINDTAELCVTCIFANESQAIGCIALLSTTANIYSMKITRNTSSSNNGSDCVTVGDSGLYSTSVYDWEGNDDDILRNKPAVKTVIYLYVTVSEAVTKSQSAYSSSIIQPSTHIVNSTAERLFSQIVIESQEQHSNGGDTVGVVFGTLFGVSLLLLLVILVTLVMYVIVGRKKSSNARSTSSSNNRSNEDTPMQMNSAYELVKVQGVDRNPSPHVTVMQDHEYTTDVYETVIADPDRNERYHLPPDPPLAPTNTHIYANVHY